MATYTYYELNADGSVPVFGFADFETDDQARLHAADLLLGLPGRSAVEVWRDQEMVGRVPNAAKP